jgi:hypothetical protein
VTDAINTGRLREQVAGIVGPAPWYWKTFPAIVSASGRHFTWTYHGESGPLGYLVSLALETEPEKPRLALNTYARPFFVPPAHLGIWCPEGRNIRLVCLDPDQLKDFDFAEIAGWFKPSSDRIYTASEPLADFEVPCGLAPGTSKIDVAPELQTVEELIVPSSYPTKGSDDPAFVLYVFYLHAGLVEVLPQRWFTSAQYQVGKQWISRAARDTESQRIFGECFGAGIFLLQEDGCKLEGWLLKE